MPTVYFAKDGTRPGPDENGPYTQTGSGIEVTAGEAQEIFAGIEVRFVGREAPSINPGPVKGSPRNVVLEVEDGEELVAPFNKVGFFFAPGISPHEVERRLEAVREKR